MKVSVITPHRSPERKPFLDLLARFIDQQTYPPDEWIVVNDPPESDGVDIVRRVQLGINRCRYHDLVLIMEDDDWYSPDYIRNMTLIPGDLIGLTPTVNYHLPTARIRIRHTPSHSSLYTTGFRWGMITRWPRENDPFLDLWLWRNLKVRKRLVEQEEPYCAIGMKHGFGKCGSNQHEAERYKVSDDGRLWLVSQIGKDLADEYVRIVGRSNEN